MGGEWNPYSQLMWDKVELKWTTTFLQLPIDDVIKADCGYKIENAELLMATDGKRKNWEANRKRKAIVGNCILEVKGKSI